MPQAVPVSTCQRIISQTGCGTDILATVGQVIIVLEAIVLWTGKATLPLVVASFSLGLLETFLTLGVSSICRHVQRQLRRNELARFYHYRTRKCLPPRKLRRDIQ